MQNVASFSKVLLNRYIQNVATPRYTRTSKLHNVIFSSRTSTTIVKRSVHTTAPSPYSKIPVKEILATQKELVFFEGQMKVHDALDTLKKNKISSAPVFIGTKCLGFVDTLDMVAFLTSTVTKPLTDLMVGESRSLTTDDARMVNFRTKEFNLTSVSDLIDLSKRNPFITMSNEASVQDAIDVMKDGIHRVAITRGTPPAGSSVPASSIINVLTQSQLVSWLWDNRKHLDVWHGSKHVSSNEFQTTSPHTCHPLTPAVDVFMRMHTERLSALPIVNDYGKLVGSISASDLEILADKDITMELLLKETREVVSKIRQQQGKSPDYVVTCALDNTVDDVISKMMSEKVHRVYITTPTQRLHSVITLTDILRFFEWGRTRQKKKE